MLLTLKRLLKWPKTVDPFFKESFSDVNTTVSVYRFSNASRDFVVYYSSLFFLGVTGSSIRIDDNGDSEGNYTVLAAKFSNISRLINTQAGFYCHFEMAPIGRFDYNSKTAIPVIKSNNISIFHDLNWILNHIAIQSNWKYFLGWRSTAIGRASLRIQKWKVPKERHPRSGFTDRCWCFGCCRCSGLVGHSFILSKVESRSRNRRSSVEDWPIRNHTLFGYWQIC